MSRWADTFAALSRDVDTSDTSRRIADLPPTLSRSVHSVTAPEPVSTPRRSATEAEKERAASAEHDGSIPRAWAEGFARLDPDRRRPAWVLTELAFPGDAKECDAGPADDVNDPEGEHGCKQTGCHDKPILRV
jgi:hypothetical protein